ncbi:ALP1-like protein, partial [Tanacetum coccineum]
NCIGAIDGTHVSAWEPTSKQKSFRGRKAVLVTQNVMAICSHDMMFTFVYTGWEGTANDSHMFYDAIIRPENKFPLPKGDYFYVVDSGYPNLKGFLAPYRGERYHRSDWQRGGVRCVSGKKELFKLYAFFRSQHYLEVPSESSIVVQEGSDLDLTDNVEMLHVRDSIANDLWDMY